MLYPTNYAKNYAGIMGAGLLDKFTHLNTFMMELAQRCLGNGGPTVILLTTVICFSEVPIQLFYPCYQRP